MLRRVPAIALGAVISAALSCMPLNPGLEFDLAGQEIHLSFLHTSDIHSRIIPYDFSPLKTDTDLGLIPEMGPFGGATRLAGLVRREKERNVRTLHVDSGDSFQGAPIFNLYSGEVEFKLLSNIGLDAAVIGNHEFDAGAPNFAAKARDFATFPLLAANYVWEDHRQPEQNQAGRYSSPYTIRNIHGVRVAIIGMANISSMNSLVEGGNSIQATPIEQNEAARAYVDLLRPAVDVVTIVSHLGLTEDQDLVKGYDAYYEYGKIEGFLSCELRRDDGEMVRQVPEGRPCRTENGWHILQWFGPQDEAVRDTSVVQVFIPGVSGIDIVFGGHLHVVLNPPQTLADPSGRKVLLVHSGAFAKYVGRLDVMVKMPPRADDAAATPAILAEGAEVLSHTFRVFPMDALWCDDAMRAYYRQPSKFWEDGEFRTDPGVLAAKRRCAIQEDPQTIEMMIPYALGMDFNLTLNNLFGYSPKDIARRNNSTGGDSPLGNLAADSMRKRRGVDAEMALTNSLGIRDNLYAGPLSHESMFNVFPFENTINIMYLSGVEMQEMFDFVATRSASRGCVSQAQVSGARFTMDCVQVQLNDLRYTCDPANDGSDCPQANREGHSPWQCLPDVASTSGGRCWAHPAIEIEINGRPIEDNGTYKVAVNDYIAKGGSGFSVLKRNTTRYETGIPLRDSLIGYMQGFCTCEDLMKVASPDDVQETETSSAGQRCGAFNRATRKYQVSAEALGFCSQAAAYKAGLDAAAAGTFPDQPGYCSCKDVLAGLFTQSILTTAGEVPPATCGSDKVPITSGMITQCTQSAGPWLGKCGCTEALRGNFVACGAITNQLKTFCENPTSMAIALGVEDGRISQRIK